MSTRLLVVIITIFFLVEKCTAQSNGQRTWTTVGPKSGWSMVAIAGQKLYGFRDNSKIYSSLDSGYTWTNSANVTSQYSNLNLATTFDGVHVVLAGSNLFISHDSGQTFAMQPTSQWDGMWSCLAFSGDGSSMFATTTNSNLVIKSADYGVTWSTISPTGISLKCSATSIDGKKLSAIGNDGYVYTAVFNDMASNFTWTKRDAAGNHLFTGIASSADGSRVTALEETGNAYLSSDSGSTWSSQACIPHQYVYSKVSSSSDGMSLTALTYWYPSHPLTSIDGGQTWVSQNGTGSQSFVWLASDSAGTVAATDGTHIYIDSRNTSVAPTPSPTMSPTGIAQYSWTTVGATSSWKAIASSNLAEKVFVVDGNGNVMTSHNRGLNWTTAAVISSSWNYFMACSSDGRHVIVAPGSGMVHRSTDSGKTYHTLMNSTSISWNGLSMSKDGRVMVAAAQYGYLTVSHDYGDSWADITSAGYASWHSVQLARDGKKLLAVRPSSSYSTTQLSWGTYDSSTGTWNWTTSIINTYPGMMSLTASGYLCKVVALEGAWGANVARSEDCGATWTKLNDFQYDSYGVMMSSSFNGKVVAMAAYGKYLISSSDGGLNWDQHISAGMHNWKTVLVSHTGDVMFAIEDGGQIHVGSNYATHAPSNQPVPAPTRQPHAHASHSHAVDHHLRHAQQQQKNKEAEEAEGKQHKNTQRSLTASGHRSLYELTLAMEVQQLLNTMYLQSISPLSGFVAVVAGCLAMLVIAVGALMRVGLPAKI